MLSFFNRKVQAHPGDETALRGVLEQRAGPLNRIDMWDLSRNGLSVDQAGRIPGMLYEKVHYYIEEWCCLAVYSCHQQARVAGEVSNIRMSKRVESQRVAALLPIAKQLIFAMCQAAVQKEQAWQEQVGLWAMKAKTQTAREEAMRLAADRAERDGWRAFLAGAAPTPPQKSSRRESTFWDDHARAVLTASKRDDAPLSMSLVESVYPDSGADVQSNILNMANLELEQGQRLALAA